MLKLIDGTKTITLRDQPWTYDVVTLKLLFEGLETTHTLRVGDVVKRPTLEFLEDAAVELRKRGLSECSATTAFQIYNLVNIQFVEIVAKQDSQLNAILKG